MKTKAVAKTKAPKKPKPEPKPRQVVLFDVLGARELGRVPFVSREELPDHDAIVVVVFPSYQRVFRVWRSVYRKTGDSTVELHPVFNPGEAAERIYALPD